MRMLVDAQLAQCSGEDRALFEQMRVPLRRISFDRGTFQEDVFVVAQAGTKLIYYDDIEDGFEVATPEADGVLRRVGCGQFELRHALAQIRLGGQ